jgi:hypothetical protein
MNSWVPAHLLGGVSVAFLHFGLIGLYLSQIEQVRWLGQAGFLLAFIGSGFAAAVQYMMSTVIPLVAADAPQLLDRATTPPFFAVLLFVICFVLGHVLFGAATARAGVLPRWAGVMAAVGIVVFFLGELSFLAQRFPSPALEAVGTVMREARGIVILGDAVFGVGLAWMGYAVVSKRRA